MLRGFTGRASSSRSPVPIFGSLEINTESVQVNDSLFELHRPLIVPSLQIVFFHGLEKGDYSKAHLTTWLREDSSCIWPKVWLAEEIPGIHVFSVRYSGDMYIIGENLLSDLLDGEIGQKSYCPVILVGHCIGGLVIKQLCKQAHDRLHISRGSEKGKYEAFLSNLKGIFYYSTPHRGSQIPKELAQRLPAPLFSYFETLSKDTARLNHQFNGLCKVRDSWLIAGLSEGLPTKWGNFEDFFVPEGSARRGDFHVVMDADHFSICRPRDKFSRSFYQLKEFVHRIAKDAQDAKEREVIRVQEEARAPENFQYVPKHVLGLDSQVQEIARKLQSTKTVGLVGMGGLGKTTLAKEVFNRLAGDFEYTCFIPNVKFIDGDEKKVFDKITEDVHFHGKKVKVEIREKWKTKPLLMVLDDISGERDLTVLSQIDETTITESRIIFTARESPWLDADKLYRVDVLDNASAEELFRSYAFPGHKSPSTRLERLLKDIVKKCEGLPLALVVLGQFLATSQEYDIWKETLDGMGRADVVVDVNKRLWAKLKLSYDGLDRKLKQMFLDATTFFSGKHWTLHDVKAAWRVMYNTMNVNLLWKQLVDMSLVYEVKQDECIKVHEQLQSLGRQIARETNRWCEWGGDQSLMILRNTMESQNGEIFGMQISPTHVAHTTILSLGANIVILDLKCKKSSLPTWIGSFSKLRFLRLDLTLPESWMDDVCTLPESFGNLFALQHLDLHWCKGLQTLPESFGDLFALQHLDLRGCSGLQTLPESFGNLSALQHLDLHWCYALQTLPESFGNLSALQHLDLHWCYALQTLPESFGNLSALQHLELGECDGLQTLPESFGDLSALQHLDLHWCYALQTLPESFGNLSALQHLDLHWCYALQTLPESFGNLSALQHLELGECDGLQTLPESFGDLSALQHLNLHWCNGLQTLPESFGNLCALQHLDLSMCYALQTLPESFGDLSALQHLNLRWCKGLQTLPESFGNLSALQHLELGECDGLQTLPESFGDLFALQHLDLRGCSALQTLPESFGNLSALQHLDLSMCYALQTLPESFGNLSALQHLDLNGCGELQTLSESFGNLSALQHLELGECDGLQTLPESFGNLCALQHLDLSMCYALQTLPESFGNLSALQHLDLSGCYELQTLSESFGNLSTLQHLELGECDGLQTLPESFGNLSALQHLDLFGCYELQTLSESFGNLSALQHLELGECDGLQTLPESFGDLSALQHLNLRWCDGLQTLPESFGNLFALQHLELGGCYKLQTLPKSFEKLLLMRKGTSWSRF